jgi:PAS domain S-box-containing protein
MDNIKLDFEQAKAKHLLFKSRLRSILYESEVDEAPVLSHFECAVGKWIYSYALKAYGHIPEMLELEKVHADIHTSARELVKEYREGNVEKAREGLSDMDKIADNLIGLLALVEKELQKQPPAITAINHYQELDLNHKELTELLIANEQLDKIIREESGELIKERKLLHSFFMQAPAALGILRGPNHLIEFANPQLKQLIGATRNIIGKPVREALPEVESQGFIELLNGVYETGTPFIGKEVPVQLQKSPEKLELEYINFVYQPFTDTKEDTEGICVFAYPVTDMVLARKKVEESEEHFRSFANSIQNLAWIANGDGWIYWYNQRWYDYTGTNLEDMQGWGWGKVHHPEHIDRVVEYVKKAWKIDKPFEMIFPLRRFDGEYQSFLTLVVPIIDDAGKICRWIGTNTNINQQKEAEEALKLSEQRYRMLADSLEQQVNERTLELKKSQAELTSKNQELEQQNAELASFTFIASHDLKEPLRKIEIYSNKIIDAEQSNLSGNSKNYLSKLTETTYRMRKLLDDIFTYAETGKKLSYEATNLSEIAALSAHTLQEQINEGAKVKYANLPTINAIPSQMEQLFTNIIGNSLKYSKKGVKPYIKIETQQDGSNWKISFADNGIGFDEAFNEKIFEIFQRLHSRTDYSGTGIGLAICKKIVENHHGSIIANSVNGSGAVFTIILPQNLNNK